MMNGILFRSDMTQAIVDDRKTQTRRLYGLKEINKEPDAWQYNGWAGSWGGFAFNNLPKPYKTLIIKPRYQVGDIVFIREAWFVGRQYDALSPSGLFHHPPVGYMSPFTEIAEQEYGRVRSPLHLPAWAARYFIKITAVRYERLMSITEADAVAEGVSSAFAYVELWDTINPDYPWRSNPLVGVYSFVKTEKPQCL